MLRRFDAGTDLKNAEEIGVPYGSRTRVAAVKEKRPIVIQGNLAAWIALYRTSRTQGNAYWTFNGPAFCIGQSPRTLLPGNGF